MSEAVSIRPKRRMGGFVGFAALVSLVITVLIVFPLVRVVFDTFFPNGIFAWAPIRTALFRPDLMRLLLDTLAVVVGATAIAVVVGSIFAWLSERTDVGMRWITRVLPIVPLLVPPIAGAIGWVMLGAPKSGAINLILRWGFSLVGIDFFSGPISVFSWPGVIFVYVLYLVPEIYLVVASGLRNVDPALEEAARMNGSSPLRTLWLVTAPSVKPAIAAGSVLALLSGFALFSVPVILGPQAGVSILSVKVVELMTAGYPPQTGVALTLGLLVLIVTGSAWWAYMRIIRAGRHAVIGGRGLRVAQVRLGWLRPVARVCLIAYLLLTAVLPFLALLIVSLQPFWTSNINIHAFTWRNYQSLLSAGYSRMRCETASCWASSGRRRAP